MSKEPGCARGLSPRCRQTLVRRRTDLCGPFPSVRAGISLVLLEWATDKTVTGTNRNIFFWWCAEFSTCCSPTFLAAADLDSEAHDLS